MKRFYERYCQAASKLRQPVAVFPWGHNLLLINKIQSLSAVEFYGHEAFSKGWTRDLLPKDALQTLILNEINATGAENE